MKFQMLRLFQDPPSYTSSGFSFFDRQNCNCNSNHRYLSRCSNQLTSRHNLASTSSTYQRGFCIGARPLLHSSIAFATLRIMSALSLIGTGIVSEARNFVDAKIAVQSGGISLTTSASSSLHSYFYLIYPFAGLRLAFD